VRERERKEGASLAIYLALSCNHVGMAKPLSAVVKGPNMARGG